jgi:hypothetical protein
LLAPCRGTGWIVFSQRYMIAFRSDPMQLEIGVPVVLVMNVCTKEDEAAELVAVEVWPLDETKGVRQHLKLVGGKSGRYRAEGLAFVSSGNWEIEFDVRSDGNTEQLTHQLIVK